jgi:hypothetical protein
MKRAGHAVLIVSVAALLLGCPHSKFYRPTTTAEQKLYTESQADIFPDDVRQSINHYQKQVVRWSGVLLSVKPASSTNGLHMLIQHHYWDWIENHSIQKAVAFLSPRGEGTFECVLPVEPIIPDLAMVQPGDMVIVYGIPSQAPSSGMLVLNCSFIRWYRRGLYATDVFDYGRNYLLKQDYNDFKVLKVPLK